MREVAIPLFEYVNFTPRDIRVVELSEYRAKNPVGLYSAPPGSLMVEMEAVHVGPTRNGTRYLTQALKGSVPTWTTPYLRPLIMHHDQENGKIIGRIREASYTNQNTRNGMGALVFLTNVPDKEGIEQIEDGRLSTVSIGAIGKDVRCSICGHNIALYGPCPDHDKLGIYEGETCFWDVYEMEGKEVSYVIVPSDIYAGNTKIYRVGSYKQDSGKSVTVIQENYEGVSKMSVITQEMYDDLKEKYDVLKTNFETISAEKEALSEKAESLGKKLNEKGEKYDVLQEKLNTEREQFKTDISNLKEELREAKEDSRQEKELRENVEETLFSVRAEKRQVMNDYYSLMRKLTKKPELTEEEISQRTEESIKDGLTDLKEELKQESFKSLFSSVNNPGLEESNDGKTKNGVKDKKNESNIDLEEEFSSLFTL